MINFFFNYFENISFFGSNKKTLPIIQNTEELIILEKPQEYLIDYSSYEKMMSKVNEYFQEYNSYHTVHFSNFNNIEKFKYINSYYKNIFRDNKSNKGLFKNIDDVLSKLSIYLVNTEEIAKLRRGLKLKILGPRNERVIELNEKKLLDNKTEINRFISIKESNSKKMLFQQMYFLIDNIIKKYNLLKPKFEDIIYSEKILLERVIYTYLPDIFFDFESKEEVSKKRLEGEVISALTEILNKVDKAIKDIEENEYFSSSRKLSFVKAMIS